MIEVKAGSRTYVTDTKKMQLLIVTRSRLITMG